MGDVTPYAVKHGFTSVFGKDLAWWLTLIAVLMALVTVEVAYRAVKRTIVTTWRRNQLEKNAEEYSVETWQEMERDPAVREMLKVISRDGSHAAGLIEVEEVDVER